MLPKKYKNSFLDKLFEESFIFYSPSEIIGTPIDEKFNKNLFSKYSSIISSDICLFPINDKNEFKTNNYYYLNNIDYMKLQEINLQKHIRFNLVSGFTKMNSWEESHLYPERITISLIDKTVNTKKPLGVLVLTDLDSFLLLKNLKKN